MPALSFFEPRTKSVYSRASIVQSSKQLCAQGANFGEIEALTAFSSCFTWSAFFASEMETRRRNNQISILYPFSAFSSTVMKFSASRIAGAFKFRQKETYIFLEQLLVVFKELINSFFLKSLFDALLAVLKESQVGH